MIKAFMQETPFSHTFILIVRCGSQTKHPMPFFNTWIKHPTKICHPAQNTQCHFCHPGQKINATFDTPDKTSHATFFTLDKTIQCRHFCPPPPPPPPEQNIPLSGIKDFTFLLSLKRSRANIFIKYM